MYRYHCTWKNTELIYEIWKRQAYSIISADLDKTTGLLFESVHEISNNVVGAISKASDQPAHMRSLIRAFACRLSILGVSSY